VKNCPDRSISGNWRFSRRVEDAALLVERGEHMAQRDRLKCRRRAVARNVEHVHSDPPLVEAKDVEHVATETLAGLVAPFEVDPVNLRRYFGKERRLNGRSSGEPRLEPIVSDLQFLQLLGEPLFEVQDSLRDANLREQPGRAEGLGEERVGTGIQRFDHVLGALSGGEQDHGKVGIARLAPELPAERNPIEFWHHPIRDQHGKLRPALE